MTNPTVTTTHSEAITADGCRGSFTTAEGPDDAGNCHVCAFRGEPTADGYIAPHLPVPEFNDMPEFEPLPIGGWVWYGMANR
jgi:hypothetical protein